MNSMKMSNKGMLRSSGGRGHILKAGVKRNTHVVRATPLPKDVTKVAPVGQRVFVKLVEEEDQTRGGVLLPDSAQKKPTGGEVVTCPSDSAVKVGSKVVYSQYAGTEVELQGKEHIILKEDDIVGIMNSDDAKDLEPTTNGILIKISDSNDKTDGGIFLTGSTKEKPSTGTVMAVGPGRKDESGKVEPVDVKIGSSVLYSKFSGVDFEANDGTELIVIKDTDVIATLE